jgi:transcriptional regulator with XRE-family HTH domain
LRNERIASRRGRKTLANGEAQELRLRFGDNLRRAPEKAKLNQTVVAARAGIRQHYVSEVENGRHNVTVGTMVKLAGAVGAKAINLLRKRPGGP